MHRIVSEVCEVMVVENQLPTDRSEARLAVLVVTDQLGDLLDPTDLADLAEALPLELALALRRRRDSSQRPSPTALPVPLVRAVCRVLGSRVGGSLQVKLRLDVPLRVMGAAPPARPSMQRPTLPSMEVPRKKAV
jgi:hypothetical protein